MPVALVVLLADVKAQRHHQRQVLLGAGHCHVQQAPLLGHRRGRAGGQVGRHAAVHHVQDGHGVPLLALGRMDGGQDQVILVLVRRAGLVAGGLGWVERELGQEALAAGRAGSQALQLVEVELAHRRVVAVEPLQMRCVPGQHGGQLVGPAAGVGAGRWGGRGGCAGQLQASQQRCQGQPVGARCRRRHKRLDGLGRLRRGRHCIQQAPGLGRPKTRQQLRHPKARQPAARVLRPAQHRQKVLDVRRLQELQPAELDKRDVAARQLQLQRGTVVAGAEQHRLLLEPQAALALRQHMVGHPPCLGQLIGHRHQQRALGAGAVAPQGLGMALGRQRDHRIAGVQDRLGRAVVAVQCDDPGGGTKLRRKAQDVADLGGAKAVDRLRVVAHHGQAPAIGFEALQDARLQPVGVLVLVDQHLVEARAQMCRQARVTHHLVPGQQQVVVVQRVLAELLGGVGAKQRFQVVMPLGAPRKILAQHLGQGQLAVHATAVDRQAGGFERKALARGCQPLLLAHPGHQVLGITAVDDAERLGQADGRRVLAQQPGADGVKGARPRQHGRRLGGAQAQRLVQHPAGALGHLLRCPARKRQQQQPVGVGAVQHQPGHPGGQCQGLARPGARQHQQWRMAVGHGSLLLGVEAGERVGRVVPKCLHRVPRRCGWRDNGGCGAP